MIATNTVKINGVLYRAGDNIPCLDALKENAVDKADEFKEVYETADEVVENTDEMVEKPKRGRKAK